MPHRPSPAGSVFVALLVLLATAPAAAEPVPVLYTDVTDSSGIHHAYNAIPPVWGGGGWAFIDLTEDGIDDVLLAGGVNAPIFAWRNHGNFTFTPIKGIGLPEDGIERALAVVDWDNDGDDDIMVTYHDRPPRLLQWDETHFVDVSEQAGLDGPPTLGTDVSWGDLDGDLDLDVFIGRYTGAPLTPSVAYRNNGDGTFTDVTLEWGLHVDPIPSIWADLSYPATLESRFFDSDNDGDLDLYVANDRGYANLHASLLYINDGTGHFTELAPVLGCDAKVNAMGLGIADFDQDSWFDILITNTIDGHIHYKYTCDGYVNVALEVGTLTNKSGWGVVAEDLNHDGWVDMYIAHDLGIVHEFNENAVYINQGDGTFVDVAHLSDAGLPQKERSMTTATADLDGDGDLDLVVCNHLVGPARILRNDSEDLGNWLHLKLIGIVSNRSAIGARVELRSDGMVMHRQVASTSAWFSTNQQRVFFGLGEADAAEVIIIRWPSGAIQTLTDVPANQVLTVVEANDTELPPLLTEVCGDGIDNDCDGDVDVAPGESCVADVSGCLVEGALICGDGEEVACVPIAEPMVTPELCGDGIDNDCNGLTDEGFDVGTPCTLGTGACEAAGTMACAPGSTMTACLATPGTPGPETCGDGVDDDCDGMTDEGFDDLGLACEVGVGGCAATAIWTCAEDGLWLTCTALAGEPVAETCGNGVDDDCDGEVDEGFDDMGAPCVVGLGACAVEGTTICTSDGLGLMCSLAVEVPAPGVELCGDGIDNDCDGAIDEGFEVVGGVCEAGTGACAAVGTTACTADGLGTECAFEVPPVEPMDEACGDAIDNDCDGMTDEGYEGLGAPCQAGVGACLRTGSLACTPGGASLICTAEIALPGDELCDNGVDDDCDGEVDEGFVIDTPCDVGVGVCRVTGVVVCTADRTATECGAVPLPPELERCGDGVDNDCDGDVDEAYPVGDVCTVGEGACQTHGIVLCAPHGYAVMCGAMPNDPVPEVCHDAIDNDCDAHTDEGCPVVEEIPDEEEPDDPIVDEDEIPADEPPASEGCGGGPPAAPVAWLLIAAAPLLRRRRRARW